jgi:hypothetical protein
MDSRREETNFTRKFKMLGPNTSKEIMATISPIKGSNHILEGSQDFIWSHTCVETGVSRDYSQSHIVCWRMHSACSLQCLKCLYMCYRKYWQWYIPLLV